MDKVYMFLSFGFLAVLFYGYAGLDPIMSLFLTVVTFAISVIGFIREETRNISLIGEIENIYKEKSL